jgi:hypothetical protein
MRAIFNTSVWLQAGQYLALAAQIPAEQKSGCPHLPAAPTGQGGGGDFPMPLPLHRILRKAPLNKAPIHEGTK